MIQGRGLGKATRSSQWPQLTSVYFCFKSLVLLFCCCHWYKDCDPHAFRTQTALHSGVPKGCDVCEKYRKENMCPSGCVESKHDRSQGRHLIELSVRPSEWKVHCGLLRKRERERDVDKHVCIGLCNIFCVGIPSLVLSTLCHYYTVSRRIFICTQYEGERERERGGERCCTGQKG